jgi:hypothetical protein
MTSFSLHLICFPQFFSLEDSTIPDDGYVVLIPTSNNIFHSNLVSVLRYTHIQGRIDFSRRHHYE